MSLFKVREWWTTQCGDGEEMDGGCLAVGNVDNESGGPMKIVVGSFSGILRIYKPSQKDYRAEDLKLEQNLGAPILQVEMGIFHSCSQRDLQLAVLHPKRLSVYGVSAIQGEESSGGSCYQLSLLYKHNLERSAYNFTYGPFGRVQGKDYIAVQSLDGELTVIEQENMAFSKFLPNFLVPGPLCYAPAPLDAFITVNSQFECECFRYGPLSATAGGLLASGDDRSKESRRPRAEWSTNLGESAVGLHVARHTAGLARDQFDILVVGESTLFWLTDAGRIRAQKRLDYFPTCAFPYVVSDAPAGTATGGGGGISAGPSHNLLVGTGAGHAVIYTGELRVAWAAVLPAAPVALRVMTAGASKIKGLIASLSDSGHLSVSFLGTEPPSQVVSVNERRELDYDGMDEEHRRLLAVIREATADRGARRADERVTLRINVPSRLDEGHIGQGWEGLALTVKLYVAYTGADQAEDVTLTVSAPAPFKCSVAGPLALGAVPGGGTPRALDLTFGLAGDGLPADTRVRIAALHRTRVGGEPRTAAVEFDLPLFLCGRAVAPNKKESCKKITIDTNRAGSPALSAVFEDLVAPDDPFAQANVLTFLYHCGDDVTILVSKNSGRYRLQSERWEALWLVARELVQRLTLHYGGKSPKPGGEDPLEFGFSESLVGEPGEPGPFDHYTALVDAHFAARLALQATHKQLDDLAQQFRAVQKRLLVRYKDRNATPLNELDTLLTMSYDAILKAADKGVAEQAALESAAVRLSAGTRLFLLLLRCAFQLDDEAYAALEAHWSPHVTDGPSQGWEETTEQALGLLLRTFLGKGKDSAAAQAGGPLSMPQDLTRLKRHMASVFERLARR